MWRQAFTETETFSNGDIRHYRLLIIKVCLKIFLKTEFSVASATFFRVKIFSSEEGCSCN